MKPSARIPLLLAALTWLPQGSAGSEEPELRFPTFEPFVVPSWEWFENPEDQALLEIELVDLRPLITEFLTSQIEMQQELEAELERARGSRSPDSSDPTRDDDARRALFDPWLDRSIRTTEWLLWLPYFVRTLQPLWEKPHWSELEVELAGLVARYLAANELGLQVTFEYGQDDRNRESLERVVKHFDCLLEEPRNYAAMVYMGLSSGPLFGEALDLPPIEAFESRMRLGELVELRLARLPDLEQPYVVQGYVGGELRWTRHLSSGPRGSIRRAGFLTRPPMDYGSYGWTVGLRVESGSDHRLGWLYVSRNGEFLFFYFNV